MPSGGLGTMSASKILGQVAPAATTLTTVYTVPASRTAEMDVWVCNTGGATTFRVSIQVGGAADNIKQYLAYDMALAANTTIVFTEIKMATGDVLKCYVAANNVSFTAMGIEALPTSIT